MAKKLGYGGIANTNGARSFAGKTEADNDPTGPVGGQRQNGKIIITARKMGRNTVDL